MRVAKHSSRTLLGAAALCALAACSGDKSYVLVQVLAAPDMPYAGVTRLVVDVLTTCPNYDSLSYPKDPVTNIQFTATKAETLSVSFTSGTTGDLQVGVTALGANDVAIGYGYTTVTIDPGHVATAQVTVSAAQTRPTNGFASVCAGDGGVTDGSTETTDVGLAVTGCQPTVAGSCTGTQTCMVLCSQNPPGAVGRCSPSGATKPAGICTQTEDCVQGAQCFSNICKVSTCQRLCTSDADCAVDGARCLTQTPIQCGDQLSGVSICSQPCDPRGAATMGCAAGLQCFLFQGEIPSCDCSGTTRTAGDGAACATSGDCQPGLMCVSTGASDVCRPVCRLDTPTDCAANRHCEMLTNYTTYGACLAN